MPNKTPAISTDKKVAKVDSIVETKNELRTLAISLLL